MKISEAIEKLTVKRDDALHFQKLYKPGDVGWSANESKAIAFNIAINTLEQIDEPQVEKVEVPQEFADWVEKAKEIKGFADYKSWCVKEIADMGWGNWIHDPDRFADKEKIYDKWVNTVHENKEKHIKAIYDGYTVKPKRWVVRVGEYHSTYVESLTITSEKSHHTISGKERAYYFKDKSKAEAVATLVEGSVEEV